MRDLNGAHTTAVETQRVLRQQIGAACSNTAESSLARRSRERHLRWLQDQKLDHPAHPIALPEMVEAA